MGCSKKELTLSKVIFLSVCGVCVLLFIYFIALFYGWGSTASRLQNHFKERVYFLLVSPQEFLVLIWLALEDERLSRSWSHPVVLNLRALDWESSNLTTRPTISISILCISQEGLSFFKPNQQINDFCKWGIFKKQTFWTSAK